MYVCIYNVYVWTYYNIDMDRSTKDCNIHFFEMAVQLALDFNRTLSAEVPRHPGGVLDLHVRARSEIARHQPE